MQSGRGGLYSLRIEIEYQSMYREKMPTHVTDMRNYQVPDWVQGLPKPTSQLDWEWAEEEGWEEDDD